MAQQQVQTEPYVDLKLLECSRKSSVEVGSGNDSNNALFMNKVEEGMMLNVGDKVSIHSAVISEIGAGGNTIELKGQRIGKVKLNDLLNIQPYSEQDSYLDSGYEFVLNRYDSVKVGRYDYQPDLYDNKVSMSIQYYKATNGENCFSLPRRFNYRNKKTAYTENDSFRAGGPTAQLRNGRFVESDYSRDRNASSTFANSWYSNNEMVKVRQDGTKFTLFTRFGTTWYNASSTKPSAPSMLEHRNGNGSIDPAVSPYLPYRELKEVEIPTGRRSADFIAESFTNSLQNASSLERYYHWANPGVNPAPDEMDQNQGVLGATYKTDTFKPFNCANSNFNSTNYVDAMDYVYPATPSQEILDWLNCFQNVCFKRPDFVESGRWDWGNGFFYGGEGYNYITKVSNDHKNDRKSMRISFNKAYNKQNCENLAKWIKTQELYPEFWDFRNASNLYSNTEETSQITGTSVNTYLAGHIGPIEISSTTPILTAQPNVGLSRSITISNSSIFPNPCNVIEAVSSGVNTYRITLDGSIVHNIQLGDSLTFDVVDTLIKLTSDNSRFLHLDMVQAYDNASKTTAQTRKEFGSDMNASTFLTTSSLKYNIPSEVLFVTYIKDDENTFYETPIYEDNSKKLTYGIFLEDSDGNIQVTVEGIGEGVPEEYYNSAGFFIGGEEAVGNGSYAEEKYKRHIGYDPHFTAYGNAAIGLYTPSASGVNEMEANKQIGFVNMGNTGPTTGGEALTKLDDKSQIINQVYLGSSNPKLTYDPTKDRFGFTEFYTPEYLGNNGAAGENEQSNAIVDGKALVYKVNKRLRRQNFAPGMGPYLQNASISVRRTDGGVSTTTLSVDLPNRNIYPFSIMDCQSGISIESFGITDKNVWDKSLLGILGFTYDQLQSPVSASNTAQSRVNTGNIKKLNKVTTQAEIKAQDTLIYNQNIWGATMYHPNITTSFILHDSKGASKKFYQWTDPIVVDTGSLTVTAEGVPRKMLNPFFTIRSDLIDEAPYMGSKDGGEQLPVMGHVNKSTDSGDFFVGGDDSIQFTMTRQKPISTITTAITDPDGTFSRVDDNSAVIYKVQRQNQLPVNLVASLFPNGM
jgi:hypothetical protein